MKLASIIFISFFVLLISCDSINKKKYTLLLHSKEKGILGIGVDYKTDSSVLEYDSDSAAYFYGKLRYEIGVAFDKELKLGKETYDFEVLNEQRENIKYNLKAESIAEMDKRAIEAAKKSGKELKTNLNKPNENQKIIEETPQTDNTITTLNEQLHTNHYTNTGAEKFVSKAHFDILDTVKSNLKNSIS